MAVGTITQTATLVGHIRRLTFTCTASSTDGSFPATVVTTPIEGRLLKLVTNPGTVQPTDNYDVVITNQHGHDVLEGVGADRDTLNTEDVPIVYSGTGTHPCVDESDTLTIALTNNSVNSAVTVVDLYYALGG